jgi:hypothetical protein
MCIAESRVGAQTERVSYTIPLEPGARPPFRAMYRVSPAELKEIDAQVKDFTEQGVHRA